jgi:hypothetical protein
MAKCPFLSSIVVTVQGNPPTTSLELVDCISSNCQIWDWKNSRCGLMTSDIEVHTHNMHHHVRPHIANESSEPVGGAPVTHFKNNTPITDPDMYHEAPDPSSAPGAASPSTLIQEYMSREDKDSNSAIFGVDFTIIDPPPMLAGIMRTPTFPNLACKITMEQYRTWISSGVSPC